MGVHRVDIFVDIFVFAIRACLFITDGIERAPV